MARRKGYIPENLTIFSRAPDTWHLDAMHEGNTYNYSHHDTPVHHTVKGRKAFAVDTTKVKGSTTASRWADAKPLKARSRLAMLFDDVDEAFEERPNRPMKNLRVFNLESRAEGGRAYKVMDEDGYVWDMREDVFVEALMEKGIKKGGKIGGEYVFGILGSQIRLVRIGSQLHKDLTEGSKLKAKKKVTAKELKVGHVYGAVSGNTGIFLGFVNVEGNKQKKQLWWTKDRATVDEISRNLYEDTHGYNFSLKQSSSFVEDKGSIPTSFTIEQVRERCIAQCHIRITQWLGTAGVVSPTRYNTICSFRDYVGKPMAAFATVTPHGVPLAQDDRIDTIRTVISRYEWP